MRFTDADIDEAAPAATAPKATTPNYRTLVRDEATAAGLDPALVERLVSRESMWNPYAKSPKGAIGLMQLMPETAAELGVDPGDPVQNIKGGVRYFRSLMDRYNGDTRLALAAYNAGPGNVDKYGDVPPFAETQAYVQKIAGPAETVTFKADDIADAPLTFTADDIVAEPEPTPERAGSPFRQMPWNFGTPGSKMPQRKGDVQLKPDDEPQFRAWYAAMAKQHDLNPDPDAKEQFYDYRAAFRAGAKPDETGHWPSQFKKPGHPNMVVGGFNVQTGQRVPGTPRAKDAAELVRLGWDPETATKLAAMPEPQARVPVAGRGTTITREGAERQDLMIKGATAGAASMAQGTAAAAEWLAPKGSTVEGSAGQIAKYFGDVAQRNAPPAEIALDPVFESPAVLADPRWWAYNGPQIVTTMLPFVIPGLAGAAAANKVATMARLTPKVVAAMTAAGGAMAGTASEALLEGGFAYSQAIEQGKTPEEAAALASKVAGANAALIGATGVMEFAPPARRALTRTLIRATLEGGQEAGQEVIQNVAAGNPLTQGVGSAAILGGLGGAAVGPVLDAAMTKMRDESQPVEARKAAAYEVVDAATEKGAKAPAPEHEDLVDEAVTIIAQPIAESPKGVAEPPTPEASPVDLSAQAGVPIESEQGVKPSQPAEGETVISDVPDLEGRTIMTGERVRDLLGVGPREALQKGWVIREDDPSGVSGYRLVQNRPELQASSEAAKQEVESPASTPPADIPEGVAEAKPAETTAQQTDEAAPNYSEIIPAAENEPETSGPRISHNESLKSVELKFAAKPDEAVRTRLKKAGFRWAKGGGVWYKALRGRSFEQGQVEAQQLLASETKAASSEPKATSSETKAPSLEAKPPTSELDPAKYHATQRGVAYSDMTDAELRELLDDGLGEEQRLAAIEIGRRQEKQPTSATEVGDPDERARRLFAVFKSAVLEDKLPKDPRELRKFAQRFVGGDPTTYTDDITDAVEAALTAGTAPVTRDVPLINQIKAAQADEAKLPRAARSLEKLDLQQFSTPLPLSVAAQYAADVRTSDRVLEPTAGTGHLVSALDPKKYNIIVSELSERRASLLKALGYNTRQGDYLGMTEKANADVIITNPPWGKYTTGKYGKPVGLGFTPGDVAERFIGKNVRDLAPGGRIVAVMPTTMLGSAGGSFRRYLRAQGRIVALVKSPPKAYDTRSTSVDSVLLVFDKGSPTEPDQTPKLVEPQTWEDYATAVEAIPPREARRADAERPAEQPAAGRPASPARPAATAERPGGRGPAGGRRPGTAAGGGTAVVPAGRDTDVVAPEPGRERPRLEREPASPRAPRATAGESTRGLSADALVAYGKAQSSQFFAPYRLRSPLAGVRHPKLVVEARNLSGVEYPALTLEPTARVARIVREGRASVEQAEQAMAAVQANIVGKHGYLAADNVGVGKSREIALTILDLMERAKKDGRPLRLLVTTKSADNIADLVDREMLQSVLDGEPPGFEIVRVADMKASKPKRGESAFEPLPQYDHAIYVTDFYNLAPYRGALQEVGLHGIIGDEAHRFKNADAAVGATWQTLHANIMLHVKREHQAFAYFTATPAQSVYDYQYLYGLRLWPIDGFNEWVQIVTGQASEKDAKKIETATEQGAKDLEAVATNTTQTVVGSDSADVEVDPNRRSKNAGEDVFASRLTPSEAEQIPREWKMLGRFSARDLWREGTEFVVHTAKLPREAKQRYDRFAQLARDVIDAADQFGKMDKSGRASRFGPKAALQAAAKRIQMQPALEEAIRIAKEQIASGHQVVLSVINVSEMDPNEGNIAAAINQINVREVEKTDEGFEDVGEIPEALIRRAELLEQAQEIGTLPDPLEMIAEAFGRDEVAFVVGSAAGSRQKQVTEFQAGKRSVAVISAAGSTGISLDHRVLTKTGAKGRRVFIDVQYEWSASEAIQRYGRVDRSAQVTPPKIIALNFGSASEKKFLATVANRMASLGALSKGGAESTGASALEEFEITGQDALEAARTAWAAQPEEDRNLWRGRQFRDAQRPEHPAAMTRATMREINLALLWLPTDKANAFWQAFVDERARIREAMGYATEARTKALRGEVLREVEISDDLTIYQVKNEAGHRFGILQGVVMPKMPRLRSHLLDIDGNLKRQYLNFTDTVGERIISGLEIPWTRVKGVAAEFGAALQGDKIDTPEKASTALKAGDTLTLQHRSEGSEAPWRLRQRKDDKIVIEGAKMADREILLRHGAGYSPVGNFWHVTDLPKFLERFPVAEPTAKASDEERGGDGGVARLPSDAPVDLPNRPRAETRPATASMRPRHLIDRLAKALGNVPIRTGHFQNRAGGIYKEGVHAIRLKIANSLRTAIHESGHAFDIAVLRLNRNDPRWRDELLALGQRTSKPSYTQKEQRKEGAAEFFVLYMMDPEEAVAQAPNYSVAVEAALNDVPEMRTLLDGIRNDLQGYLGLSPAEQGRLAINRDHPSKAAELKQRVQADPKGAIRTIAARTVDDLAWLKAAVEQMRDGRSLEARGNAYTLARIARGSAGKAEAFLEVGVRARNGKFIGPSLKDALEPVKGRLNEFGDYLTALRIKELIVDRGRKHPGMTLAQAEAIIKETEAREDFEQFTRARDLVWHFQDSVLTYGREYGALSQDQVRKIRSLNQAYVPLQRVFDAADEAFGGGGARRIANRRTPIHRIGDSNREIVDPLESIIGNTFAMVDMVEKNRAMQALVRQAEQSAGSARWIEHIPTPSVATRFHLSQITGDIRAAMEAGGLGDALPDNLDEALDALVTVFTPATFANDREQIVTVIRDGKRQFWQVNSKHLYDAITMIGAKDTANIIQLVGQRLAGILRTTATTTPSFIIRNVMRDSLVAYLQSRHGFIPIVDQVRAAISMARGDEAAKLFFTSGVQQSALVGNDRKHRAEMVRKLSGGAKRSIVTHPTDLVRAAFEFLQHVSQQVETVTRLAEFKLALEAGGAERGLFGRITGKREDAPNTEEVLARATLAARDVTTDFQRGGSMTKEASRYYAFLNARVQGYVRMAETVKRDPVGVSWKLGTLALFSAALWFLNEDDKEYQEKEEWEKDAYWHLPIGNGLFARIPKPFEWGYLGAGLWEAALDYMKHGDATRFREMKEAWFPGLDSKEAALRTVISLMPTAVLPLLEAGVNYSSFRDAPIVSPWDLDMPKDQQYTRWTSESAKLVNRYLLPFLSPAQIDHILQGYTSNVGRGAAEVSDYALGKMGAAPTKTPPARPLSQYIGVGAVLDDGSFGGGAQSIQDVYDLAEAFDALKKSEKAERAGGNRERAKERRDEAAGHPWAARRGQINTARGQFKVFGKQIGAIYESRTMTPTEKAQRIQVVRERMIDTARRALGRRPLPRVNDPRAAEAR